MLHLHNPHSVLAVLESRPKDVTEISLGKNPGDAWESAVQAAKKRGIKIGSGGGKTDREGAGRISPSYAVVRERESISPEELFSGAKDRAGGKGLWLALDSLQDPQNVGSIFRTAAFFGVQGILLTQERSSPLTSTVYDVASGGLETVPFSAEINLQRAFEKAKDAGLWILGSSEHAHDDIAKVERDRPWLLVIGNEEKGMRRLTEEACDVLCKIPSRGKVGSLNASVAAGILISHLS